MDLIELSIDTALNAHKGQKDKAGKPYILHPLRLMAKMQTPNEMMVAVLHDVLEDSSLTAADLVKLGIPDEVVKAIECLTKCEGEAYGDYLERVLSSLLAVKVKRADLEDNMNILRLDTMTDKDLNRLQKYHQAWQKLSGL
ncbi:hypothetical protein [Shewanella surugensis]|uniref:GTP pyrophosphokinase n=1 Tax=Shewanella surugensis TaxID=212020 RepID=A0ABT0LBL9_9GAMM|nr:hypothetical protein [Shewanella surugensis]MCL1125104.1 hypothetical protein [Shewanella surugensis]